MTDLDGTELLVLALAVYRLTILVTADKLTAPVRDPLVLWLNERKHGPLLSGFTNEWHARVYQDPHKLAYLLQCSWCASVWLGGAATAVTYWRGPDGLWGWFLVALAAAGTAAILASRFAPDDQ